MVSLIDDALEDNIDILEDNEGAVTPILITSPPEETRGIPANTEFGTLDPDDLANRINAFTGDHHTQYTPDIGAPQAGLNSKASITLKTLLDKGIIEKTADPDLVNFQVAWLDPVSGQRRDFLITNIFPTRSLFHIVLILSELEIEAEA